MTTVARGEPWLHAEAQRLLVNRMRKPSELNPLELLTDRERSVLKLLAQGQSNKNIGKTLQLTEGTVKGYVSNILAKLKLEDRTQAALLAVKLGLDQLALARAARRRRSTAKIAKPSAPSSVSGSNAPPPPPPPPLSAGGGAGVVSLSVIVTVADAGSPIW